MEQQIGRFNRTPDGYEVVFERKLNYPADAVWWAITDPDKIRLWFTDVRMEFIPGGFIEFLFRDKNRTEISGHIVAIEPGKVFEYSLKGENGRWEVTGLDEKSCLLTFVYSGIIPQYIITIATGWHIYLDQLEAVLGGRTKPFPFSGSRESKQVKTLKTIYEKILLEQFPEFQLPKSMKALVTQRTYYASAEEVWKALTDPEEMKKWYFDIPDFKAEEDHEFEFLAGPSPENQYLHRCKVISVVPLRRLTYTWRYAGYRGDSLVTFALYPKDGKTVLILTHRGLETFPSDNPDFAVERFAEGWKYFLGVALKNHVEKWRYN